MDAPIFLYVFGHFWTNLGKIRVSDVTIGVKILELWKSDTIIGFLTQKTYLYQIWEQDAYFIEDYGISGHFWTILGNIGGQWRQKRGQNFKIL